MIPFRSLRRPLPFVAALLALALAGCSMPIALDPRGPAAADIATIWWILFWTATAVTIIVFILLFVAFKRANDGTAKAWTDSQGHAFVLIGGGIIPTIILLATTFFALTSMRPFDQPPDGQNLTVLVRGHMFWWEIEYPDHGFTTANELHIPVGRPVRILLETEDVIHSFWVPQLAGKIEMIPGWTNEMYIQADEPGTYYGNCAEFCGVQHAHMEFLVIAQHEGDFEAWAEHQQTPARAPATELERRGQQVFLGSSCVYCHTVRGTNASGRLGPDLTHLMSRRTIGARMLENNRGNLAGWTVNAQAIKPGNRMPPMYLQPEALQAVVAYLESLE